MTLMARALLRDVMSLALGAVGISSSLLISLLRRNRKMSISTWIRCLLSVEWYEDSYNPLMDGR